MNKSLTEWVDSLKTQRRFNMYYRLLYCLAGSAAITAIFLHPQQWAQVLVAASGGVCIVGLFHNFTNLLYIAGRPRLNATDEEILEAAMIGPSWLRQLIEQAKTAQGSRQ